MVNISLFRKIMDSLYWQMKSVLLQYKYFIMTFFFNLGEGLTKYSGLMPLREFHASIKTYQ